MLVAFIFLFSCCKLYFAMLFFRVMIFYPTHLGVSGTFKELMRTWKVTVKVWVIRLVALHVCMHVFFWGEVLHWIARDNGRSMLCAVLHELLAVLQPKLRTGVLQLITFIHVKSYFHPLSVAFGLFWFTAWKYSLIQPQNIIQPGRYKHTVYIKSFIQISKICRYFHAYLKMNTICVHFVPNNQGLFQGVISVTIRLSKSGMTFWERGWFITTWMFYIFGSKQTTSDTIPG